MFEQLLGMAQQAFPTTLAGGGVFGVYLYFRKIDQAIRDDLRKTIAAQAEEIKTLWKECRDLRRELRIERGQEHEDESEDDK